MKKFNRKINQLWMDQFTFEDEQKYENKENQNNFNSQKIIIQQNNKTNTNMTLQRQLTFAERFKDKLSAFNKSGKICRLQQKNSLRASLVFQGKIKNKPNKTIKHLFQPKKIEFNSRMHNNSTRMSVQSKQSQRIVKSLEASKISSVFQKQEKHRYGSDCYSIKQEQIQQTVSKNPINIGRIYTPLTQNRKQKSLQRNIYFQCDKKSEEGQKNRSKNLLTFKKQTEEQKNMTQATQTIESKNYQKSNLIKDRKRLPTIGSNRPSESVIKKRIHLKNPNICLTEQTERNKKQLPKIQFKKFNHDIKTDNGQLLTIR